MVLARSSLQLTQILPSTRILRFCYLFLHYFGAAGIIVFLQMGNFFLRKLEQQRASKLRRPKFGFTPLIGPQTTKCKQGPLPWRPSGRHVCTRVYIPDWTKIHTHTYTCLYIYKTGQGNLTPNNGKFVYPKEG